jgi:hypothetical protein
LASRNSISFYALLAVLIAAGGLMWRKSSTPAQVGELRKPVVSQQPVNFTNRTFDPANPPADMPPLAEGEEAQCDSDFTSHASVGGKTLRKDATHATLIVAQIKMTLQLNIIIWVPTGASQHVIEHEEGHRQISEFYYQTSGKLAERIAANYMGRQVDIAGTDLQAESSKALQQIAAEITAEYGKQLNPTPTQLLYDDITAHSRNEIVAKDAVVHAINNVTVEYASPVSPD